MVGKLGYGQRRLVEHIVKSNWNTDAPDSVKLKLNDVLFILQEMHDQEGMKYFDEEKSSNRGFYVFRNFAKHLLYRNLANYDSMILLTSEKGCLTDDTKIMMPRDLLKYPEGIPIKDLIGKGPIHVYSFNKDTNQLELKKSDGVEFAKHADVYELELVTGQKIKATEDHPFMLMDGSYKKLNELLWLDKIKDKPGACFSRYREKSVWKYTDRLRMVITKSDVNDYLKVDYSPIKNGKNFYNKQIEYRFILSQLGIDVNNKIVHHDDENHFNNSISNLKVLSQPEHIELHLKDYYFKQNNTYCQANGYTTKSKPKIKNGSDEFKELVSCQRKEYFSNKDNVEKYKTIMQTNGKHTNMYRYGGVIKSITFIGKENVYDVVNVQDNKNFIANGFVVSNTGKSSAAVMLAREWCKLIGIRFDPKRHIAYNNSDVMQKIDMLNKFEPLVCLTGDTRVKIRRNDIVYEERIDKLVELNDYEVLTYNVNLQKYEYKKPEKTIKQPIKKAAYTIELENGNKIKATENHLILTKKGYKKICDLTEDDEVKIYEHTCEYCKKSFDKSIKRQKYCSKECGYNSQKQKQQGTRKEYLKQYRKKNKNILKQKRIENKERINHNKRKYAATNISYRNWRKKYNKEYHKQNYERLKELNKNWIKNNYEKYRQYLNNRHKDLMVSNPQYKIKRNLRRRISLALNDSGLIKDKMLSDYIGCSVKNLKQHLEKQFKSGMCWDNYGKWHVDHIIPCASFDLNNESAQKECFNYKNLQPLWSFDNLSKGAKI